MERVAAVANQLQDEFSAVEPSQVTGCVEAVARQVDDALPAAEFTKQVLARARLRLAIELLGGDVRLATELMTAGSLAEVGRVARTAARQRLRCAGATFVLLDGDKCFYADEDSIAPLWAGQRFPVNECVSGWAMLHDEAAVIDDIALDARVPQEAYRSTYVRSMLVMPISGRHGPAAAIGAYWPEAHHAGRADLPWLRGLARVTGAAIAAIGLADAPWAPNFRIGDRLR